MSEQPSVAHIVEHIDDSEDLSVFENLLERHMIGIMWMLGLMQLMFSAFAFVNRLNPTVESLYDIVDLFIDSKFWAGCYLLSGFITLAAVKRQELRAVSMALSTGTFGVWGFLCIAKSFTSVTPIAWSIGFAVMGLGWVSYKLCLVWGIVQFDPVKAK